MDTPLGLLCFQLNSIVLFQFWSDLRLTVPSCNSSARTPRKTPSSVVKNAYILVRCLKMDIPLLRAYSLALCLPSRCLAINIRFTTFLNETHKCAEVSIIRPSAHESYAITQGLLLISSLDFKYILWGTRWRSWLRYYATSRNIAGSNPDEVTGFFNWPIPSSCIMALGSTQPLTERSTRNFPGG
jgi:hypothetical protein